MAERSRLGLMITMWAEHDFEVCFDNGLSQIEPLDFIWKKWLAQILWPHTGRFGELSLEPFWTKKVLRWKQPIFKPLGIPRWRWNHKDRVLFWQLPAGKTYSHLLTIKFIKIHQEPLFWFSKWDIFLLCGLDLICCVGTPSPGFPVIAARQLGVVGGHQGRSGISQEAFLGSCYWAIEVWLCREKCQYCQWHLNQRKQAPTRGCFILPSAFA